VVSFNKYIFRDYDVRGIVGQDLDEERMEILGKAFGTKLVSMEKNASCTVARDNRKDSLAYKNAFVKGLVSTGCDAIDVGQGTTPLGYFAQQFLKATGTAIITASHNPPQYNGLKMRVGNDAFSGKKLGEIVLKGEFAVGKKPGSVSEKNIYENYVNAVTGENRVKRRMRVVVDSGNGMAGPLAVAALKRIGCEVIELFTDPDSNYPHHIPDVVKPENYPWLVKKVREEKADLGIMLDGDGDRVAAVDEKGNILWPDMLLVSFAREALSQKKGAKIVVEIKCSQKLIEDVENRGGKALLCKTGYPFVEEMMEKEGSPVGGEMSGHFFFFNPDGRWFSDAIYAACRFVKIVSESGKPLSRMFDDLPVYYASQEYRFDVHAPDEGRKYEIVAELVREFKKTHKVIDIDGARVLFPGGWGLVRASNNEPLIVMRFESKTREGLEKIARIFREKIARYPEVKAKF
jgi:phosphomannomutase/phosphoglucomutase